MSTARPRQVHPRDLRFAAFVLANLLCLGGFIAGSLEGAAPADGGWRRIDRAALQARIDAGDLASREARWYRDATEPRGPGLAP
jgi:hypothetical protein